MKPQVFPSISSFRRVRDSWGNLKVGFVPTMGSLHKGHLNLLKEAKNENDKVVCSIFVNPLQFGHGEDFNKYPRNFEKDKEILGDIADCVFTPTDEEMYPMSPLITVNAKEFETNTYEGRSRPGHFQGVATVVNKLFNIVQPTQVYFGQKDAMQCILIRNLIKDFSFPIQMKVIPTVREDDGLAFSSRNRYLNPTERKTAAILYKALIEGQELFKVGETNRNHIIKRVRDVLSEQEDIKVEYVSLAALDNGIETQKTFEDGTLLSAAIRIGDNKTRLIDCIILKKQQAKRFTFT